jgi:hypothetical protein
MTTRIEYHDASMVTVDGSECWVSSVLVDGKIVAVEEHDCESQAQLWCEEAREKWSN